MKGKTGRGRHITQLRRERKEKKKVSFKKWKAS
jgi:hypothetical protein